MRTRPVLIAALSVALLMALPAAASAVTPSKSVAPMAVLGIDFPSVKEIVGDVVKFFFSTLLDALVPDWLKDASVGVIRRLVTIPNPTDQRTWPTLARLSDGMRWIALPLLSLAAVAGWVQQWLREMTGRPGSLAAVLSRTALAALLLIAYPVIVSNAVALVNSITNAMLSLPAVQQGLERTIGLVFAGSLLSGSGVLLALLGIAAVVLAVGLFMLSVGLLVLFAIAFVSAPFAIACSVLDETRGVWTAWRYTLLTASLVPVGWCVLFATAGAFARDMTTWSGGVAGTIGARFVGVFAALIVLWLAIRWPLMLWSTIRQQLGGALLSVGRGAGMHSRSTQQTGGAARASLQRAGMRTADGLTGALGAAHTTAATSARMALGDSTRALGRLPGSRSALIAGGIAAAPASPLLAQAAKKAASVARPMQRGVGNVRERARAAGTSAKRAYARGATSREAAGAGAAAAIASAQRETRGTQAPAPRQVAKSQAVQPGHSRTRARRDTGRPSQQPGAATASQHAVRAGRDRSPTPTGQPARPKIGPPDPARTDCSVGPPRAPAAAPAVLQQQAPQQNAVSTSAPQSAQRMPRRAPRVPQPSTSSAVPPRRTSSPDDPGAPPGRARRKGR